MQRLIHSDFGLFELSVWLHTFARSMIAIFIPILLLTLGFEIRDVLLYYFLYMLFDGPLNFLARWLVQKIGARWVIVLGSLASIIFFGLLYSLTGGNWPLLVTMALLAGVYDSFYWVAHLYLFMICSKHDENVSRDTSFLYIARRIAGLTAPALGALILIFLNQQVLIVVSIILLFVSIIPLFVMKKLKDKPRRKSKTFFEFFKKWHDFKEYLSRGLLGVHLVTEDVMWPLFIFTIFATIESVAILPIIVSITSIIFTYFIGNAKKGQRSMMIMLGGFFIALLWILRLVIDNTIFYYASVFLVGFFTILVTIPIDSEIFERGEKRDALTASMYRNTFGVGARAALFGVLLLLINVFQVSFLTAVIGMFTLIFITYIVKKSTSKIKIT